MGRCHLKDSLVDNVELTVLIQTTGNFNGAEKLWVFWGYLPELCQYLRSQAFVVHVGETGFGAFEHFFRELFLQFYSSARINLKFNTETMKTLSDIATDLATCVHNS